MKILPKVVEATKEKNFNTWQKHNVTLKIAGEEVRSMKALPLNETHLYAVRELIYPRGFAQCVNKLSSSERRNCVRTEQTYLFHAEAKDLTQSRI